MGKIHTHGFNYETTTIRNLYKCILQREVDAEGLNYRTGNYDAVVEIILNSGEYSNLDFKSLNSTLNKKINYTVMKVDNRADATIKDIHDLLDDNFIYNEIEFFNYKKSDINKFYSDRGIDMCWMADVFGLSAEPKIGEYACLASHIVALEHLVNNDLDELIVFEDDIILNENFINIFSSCFNDLPKDYDALADSTYIPNYQETSTEVRDILIDSDYISKAYLQNSHTGFIMYSKEGAKKILELFIKYGAIAAIDTYLFWLNRRDSLNIYTTFYNNRLVVQKDIYGSIGKE